MARPKPLDNYPPEYFSLLRQGQHREVVIACDSSRAAQNLRNELYTFRSVVRKHGSDKQASEAGNLRFKVTDNILTVEPIRRNENGTETQS